MFYDKTFISPLADEAFAKNQFDLFKGKGGDLYDNATGKRSGDLHDHRKSIIKTALWEQKAEEKIAKAKLRGIPTSSFEKYVVQIMNHANYGARKLLIDFLSEPLSKIDQLESVFISFKYLKPVLYVDKPEL
jgi:hypothetical protein